MNYLYLKDFFQFLIDINMFQKIHNIPKSIYFQYNISKIRLYEWAILYVITKEMSEKYVR